MSLGHGASIVRDGLVLNLDAINPKSYPSAGTSWNDLSGNSNTGTLVNGVEPVKQNSIVLDGSGDFLTLTNLSATYLSTDFCIESWVYVTSQVSQTLFNTIPHQSFDINLNRAGSGQTALFIGNGSAWQTLDFRSSGTLTANQWHHIAVTRNSNVITIWHNGVSQGSTSAFMPTGFGTTAYIGTFNGSTGENVNGKLYGYRIVSGSPVYTQNFTPPARMSNISGTQLIVAQDGGFVNSASTSVVATPSGNTYVNDNGYMLFDGVNDYVIGTSNLPLSGNPSFTISYWARWDGATFSADYPSGVGNNSTGVVNTGVSTTWSSGRIALDFWNNRFRANSALNVQQWYHVSFVKTAGPTSSTVLYVNGVSVPGAVENGDLTPNITAAAFIVGRLDATRWFQGRITGIMIYNKALSATEIQQNFEATRGRYGI